MILLDALIVIGVLIGFILGFKDGFVRKLVGILGFVIAVVAAVFFSHNLGLFIESVFMKTAMGSGGQFSFAIGIVKFAGIITR